MPALDVNSYKTMGNHPFSVLYSMTFYHRHFLFSTFILLLEAQ